MNKNADSFLKRFEGRYERMGAGGIKDVSLKDNIITNFDFSDKNKKKKENPINERKKNQKMYSRMMNEYNLMTTEEYKRYGISKRNNNNINLVDNNYNGNNEFQPTDNYKMNKDIQNVINKYNNNIKNSASNNNINFNNNLRNSSSNNNINFNNNLRNSSSNNNINFNYNKNYNNSNFVPSINQNNSYPPYELMDNDYNYDDYGINNLPSSLIDNDRFYRPYSLKEYKEIMQKFKNDKFGGLGKNMNKAWKEREKKFNKVKKFENSVVKNFNQKINNNYKRLESPQKMEMIKIGKQIMNSKRYAAQKYGKGVMLNKVRDQMKKDKLELLKLEKMKKEEELLRKHEYERKQREEDIMNIYDNIVHERNDDYINKLNQLKSSLI